MRPEPFAILSYCDVRLGAPALGVSCDRQRGGARSLQLGAYGLALVRASAGLDPRAAARRALELNPLEGMVSEMLARSEDRGPSKMEETAGWRPLPVDRVS